MMKKIKEIAENKIVKIIRKTIKIFIGILLVGFMIVVCMQRFSDNKISFFNYRMFTVVSGSMKPLYDIGDVLIAKKVAPSTIKVRDNVSYEGNYGGFKDKVITHQVVSIEKSKTTGKYIFHTKGLANLVEDPIVTEDQVYGVVIYKSIILSFIYRIVATQIGFYLFIIIPILYVVSSEIITAMLNNEEKRRARLRNGSSR